MLQDAIATYHDLLDGRAADSHQRLGEQQRRRGLTFDGRPLCTVLRPRFLTVDQYRFLRQRVPHPLHFRLDLGYVGLDPLERTDKVAL